MNTRAWLAGLVLIGLAYGLGLASAHYRLFPYTQITEWVKDNRGPPPRIRDTHTRTRVDPASFGDARIGVFVAYGQSNSENGGQIGYTPTRAVYQAFDGAIYAYTDPALGGTGHGGSVWGRVGDLLIERGVYDVVIFAVTGVGGTRMGPLADGPAYDFFADQYRHIQALNGPVGAILMHQGESNHRLFSSEDYAAAMDRWRARLAADGLTAPIYLAQASVCGAGSDPDLLTTQDRIIRAHSGILRGPNSDTLTAPALRLPDRCHFSLAGQKALADAWVNAILAAAEQ